MQLPARVKCKASLLNGENRWRERKGKWQWQWQWWCWCWCCEECSKLGEGGQAGTAALWAEQ